jgi:hypothetical protein
MEAGEKVTNELMVSLDGTSDICLLSHVDSYVMHIGETFWLFQAVFAYH